MKSGILFFLLALSYPIQTHANSDTVTYSTTVGEFDLKDRLIAQPAMAMAVGKKYGAEISITGLKGPHKVSIEVIPPDPAPRQPPGTTRVNRVTSSTIIDFKSTPHTYGTGAYTLLDGQPLGNYEFKFYIDGNLVAQHTFGIR